MIYTKKYVSPLGEMLLAEENDALIGLWFTGQKYFPSLDGQDTSTPCLERVTEWLDRYFAGKAPDISEIPILLRGSDFRLAVWHILTEIPYGTTLTYGEIAGQLEKQTCRRVSAQAVGGAVGHNPISVIVPCHRVVGADGSLTGYAGGTDKKAWLLQHEKLTSSHGL